MKFEALGARQGASVAHDTPEIRPHRPPSARECVECRTSHGMKLQNIGIFTAHYICEHCGFSLTVPPPALVIPRKDFEPKEN